MNNTNPKTLKYFFLLYCVMYAGFERIPFIPNYGITYQQIGLMLLTASALIVPKKISTIKKELLCVPIALYCFYVGQSLVGSIIFNGPKILIASLLVNFIFVITCYISLGNIDLNDLVKKIAKICLAIIPFEFTLQLLQIYFPEVLPKSLVPGGRFIDDYFRPPGFFQDPNFLGLFAAISFGYVYLTKNKITIVSVVLPCLILTGSYTASGALIIATCIIAIITKNYKIIKGLGYVIILTCFFVIGVDSFRGYFISKLDVITLNPIYNIRMLYAILGYEMGITSPLFGHGYGNYDWGIAAYLPDWVSKMRYYVPNFIDSKKGFISHVLYATVFAENGIIGLIAVVGFIFGPIIMLIKAYIKRPEGIKLFLINATIVFAVSTFSYGFRLSNGFFLLFLILSVAYVNRERY